MSFIWKRKPVFCVAIRFDELVGEVMDMLDNYVQEVTEDVKKDVKVVARECKRDIQNNSPVRFGGYKKSWKATTVYEGRGGIRIIVHNGKYYRLTHLLENGHAKVSGGRVEGKPHIRPAEERAARSLEKKVEVSIKK